MCHLVCCQRDAIQSMHSVKTPQDLTVQVRRGLQCHPKGDIESSQEGIFAEVLSCQIAGIDDTV